MNISIEYVTDLKKISIKETYCQILYITKKVTPVIFALLDVIFEFRCKEIMNLNRKKSELFIEKTHCISASSFIIA